MNTFSSVRRLMVPTVAFFMLTPSSVVLSEDLLQVGCRWKGKLTQEGVIPLKHVPSDIEAIFVITERNGDKFKARLEEKARTLEVTYTVEGEIKRSKDGLISLSFKTVDAVSSSPRATTITNVSFNGRIKMAHIAGTWNYPKDEKGIVLNGTFDFAFKSLPKKEKKLERKTLD